MTTAFDSDAWHDHVRRLVDEPSEIDRRRAVSAAYYTVFHAIADEFAGHFSGAEAQAYARRIIGHGAAKTAAQKVAAQGKVMGLACPPPIVTVAKQLVWLQAEREKCDYDLGARVSGVDARIAFARARAATKCLAEARADHPAELEAFVLSLVASKARSGG